ncbi:MAG: type II 3-dehydroquinate dehydratase [FCB group bacterium]|nr:type II 3-dehydroquinate dehydratase [FCB group bacterium]
MKTILVINGPNLNLLGRREPDVYGRTTLPEIEAMMKEKGQKLGLEIKSFQSNHEGGLIDFIHAEYQTADGIIINPGAFTHYSYALRDCLAAVDRPVVEVHISNLQQREEWRRKSVMTEVCIGLISGLGIDGYLLALEYFIDK